MYNSAYKSFTDHIDLPTVALRLTSSSTGLKKFVHNHVQSLLMSDCELLCAAVCCCVSGEAEFSTHHNEAKRLSPSLCYFMAKKAELDLPAPQTSTNMEVLVHYVKVVEGSSKCASPESVECVLFTSGK